MKNLHGLLLLCAFFCIANVSGQNIPVYPIPTFGVEVNGYACFSNGNLSSELCNQFTDEKKEIKIHLQPISSEEPGCEATVWVYSLDQTTVLGPYYTVCGEILSIEVDDREWGVMVNTECEVEVDVWIE